MFTFKHLLLVPLVSLLFFSSCRSKGGPESGAAAVSSASSVPFLQNEEDLYDERKSNSTTAGSASRGTVVSDSESTVQPLPNRTISRTENPHKAGIYYDANCKRNREGCIENIETGALTIDSINTKIYPRVLKLLEDARREKPEQKIPQVQANCTAHHKFNQMGKFLNVQNKLYCAKTYYYIDQIYSTRSTCDYVNNPISYIKYNRQSQTELFDTSDVEGMLKVLGSPLIMTKLLPSLKQREYKKLMDNIILKFRMDDYIDTIRDRKKALGKIIESAVKDEWCLKNSLAIKKFHVETMLEMQKELQRMENKLRKLYREGVEQARIDRAAIRAKGRNRDSLPFASLTDEEREIASMALSALLWRARGGGLYLKDKSKIFATQYLRTNYVLLPYPEIVRINGGSRTSFAGVTLFPHIFTGWSLYFDVGRLKGVFKVTGENHTGSIRSDYLKMAERGRFQVETLMKTLRGLGYDVKPLQDAGTQMGACYLHAWARMANYETFKPLHEDVTWGTNLKKPYVSIVSGPITWGELCWGAVLGIGISKTLLNGYR